MDRACRGEHIGELLVKDCLEQAKANGYRVLQFNAVVASNIHAFHLYQRLGFVDLGVIPGGFLNKDGVYEDIHVMYHNLVEDYLDCRWCPENGTKNIDNNSRTDRKGKI